MATGNIEAPHDRTRIICAKDALSLNEITEVLGMTREQIEAIIGNGNYTGDDDKPFDWDGDMTDEEILALLGEDTSENAHD